MRLLVLGAGLQGAACAFDLLRTPAVTEVVLADLAVDHLPAFLKTAAPGALKAVRVDVRDRAAVWDVMRGCHGVMSAVPYYLNGALASLAVEAGVHFCDLGGNTDVVLEQKALDGRAREQGVSIVPDCGLAPGLVNVLAQHGIEQLERVDTVKIFVGGLPQEPQPPLNYHLVYSLEGVLDYYTTTSWILRDGRRQKVEALSEIELVEFPAPVGTLEAFHTAGGLSTMAFRYEGVIPRMEYKTLRYPGHAAIMHTIRSLGFLEQDPIDIEGRPVSPRAVAIALMKPRLSKPDAHDFVAVRVEVMGERGGRAMRLAWELVDRFDVDNGISAMMRTTGYSLAITGVMQAMGRIPVGVHTPDECMPATVYFRELALRGLQVQPAI